MYSWFLTSVLGLPVLGALVVALLPGKNLRLQKSMAFGFSGVTFMLSAVLCTLFDPSVSEYQFRENREWIGSLHLQYLLGIDGMSLVLLTIFSLLFFLAICASFDRFRNEGASKEGARGYFALILLFEGLLLGGFCALDLFLFYSFWAGMLVPIYFLIGVWGGRNREHAAMKFLLFQFIAAIVVLFGLFILYFNSDPHSLSLLEIAGGKFSGARIDFAGRSFSVENFVFTLFVLGFFIRMAVVPLHGWFTTALCEAPFPVSALLSTGFLASGVYGVLRVCYSLFPAAAQDAAMLFSIIGLANLLYGVFCGLAQRDLRRLIAFFLNAQVGVLLVGMASFSIPALHGTILHLVSFSVSAGLMIFLVGIIGHRAGSLWIIGPQGERPFGGLVSRAPLLTAFFSVGLFSAIGLPGLSGFPSTFMVMLGAFPFHRIVTAVSLFGLFLAAGTALWMYRRVFWGSQGEKSEAVFDLTALEKAYLLPVFLLCFLLGVYPAPLLNMAKQSVANTLTVLEGARK